MLDPLEQGKSNLTLFSQFLQKLALEKSGRFSYDNTQKNYDIFEIRQAFEWAKSHNNKSLELEQSIEIRIALLQNSLDEGALKIQQLSPYKGVFAEESSIPQENFREFSFLHSFKHSDLDFKSHLEDPQNHLFAHLHLGARALGTGFEGESSLNTVSWLESVLNALENPIIAQNLPPVSQMENLKSSLEGLKEVNTQISIATTFLKMTDFSILGDSRKKTSSQIHNLAIEIGSSIKKLASGTSYLMPGGYSGSPAGHAMFYRFTKEQNGTYTVVIYNAGDGAQWQNLLEEKGVSMKKVTPYVVFSEVKEEEIFSKESSPLLEALLKLQILPAIFPLDPTCRFGSEDVWKAFFPIHHRQIDVFEYSSLFMTLQRSGTCAQKSLNACVLDLLEDPVAYKALNFNSQILSLTHYYHAHASRLSEPSQEMNQVRFQLKEATTHLFQKLLRYAKGKKDSYPRLTESQRKGFIGTLQELQDTLDVAEKKAVYAFQQNSIRKKRVSESTNPKVLQQVRKEISESHSQNSTRIETPIFSPLSSIDPQEVPELLKKLVTEDPQKLSFSIEKIFSLLPIPQTENDPFWSKVPLSLDLLKNISSILRSYIDLSTRDRPFCRLNQYQTVLTGYAAMHQLCWRYDREHAKGFLQDYSVSISLFEDLFKKDRFLIVEDPKEWEKYTSGLNYFKYQNQERKIFAYNEVELLKSEKFEAEVELYGKIFEVFPNKKKGEQYLQKRKEQLEKNYESIFSDNQLFAEDALKESWISQGDWFSGKNSPQLNFLRQTKHDHIAIFKQLAFDTLVAFDTQGAKEDTDSLSCKIDHGKLRIHNLNREFCLERSSSSFNKDYSQAGKKTWPKQIQEELSKSYLSKYFKEKPVSEGKHLLELAKLEGIAKRRAYLAGSLCYHETAASTLLYRITQDPLLLEDPISQGIVKRVLWMPHSFSDGMKVPLFEEIQNRGEIFLEQMRETVHRGLQYSLYAQSSEGANLKAALFFIQLAQQAEECYRKIHGKLPTTSLYPVDVFERLEQVSRQRDPAIYSLASTCLVRLNHYITKSESHQWTAQDWRKIYQNALLLQTFKGMRNSGAIDERLWDSVFEKMRLLESSFFLYLKEHPESQKEILDGMCNILGIDDGISFWQKEKSGSLSEKSRWKQILNSLTFEREDGLTINLAEGRVVSKEGELQLGPTKLQQKDFQKIFGTREILIQTFGSMTQFHDDRYGLCRLLANGVIQRKIGDSWYSYASEKLLQKYAGRLKIPKAFYGGYIHWIRTDKKVDVRISDQKSAEDCFQINEKGELFPTENETRILEPIPQMEKSLLNRFEKGGYILGWKTGNRGLVRMEMPRYNTKMGKSLSFAKQGKEWTYENDPRYILQENPFLPSLGHFSKFLLLSDRGGKGQKCLIPYQKIESIGFSTQVQMKLEPPPILEKQEGVFSYFEFSVKEGELVAEGIDGWLMLAQIYAAGKDYIRAGRCLDQITLSDQLTPETRNLFRAILLSGKETRDYSPNASALRLKAFLMLKKLDPFTKGSEVLQEDSEHPKIENVYHFYLRGLKDVYDPLKLSSAIELELISILGNFEQRRLYLSGESWENVKKIWKPSQGKSTPYTPLEEWDFKGLANELNQMESSFYYPQRFLSWYTNFKTSDLNQRNALAYELQWRGIKDMSSQSIRLLYFVSKYPEKCPKPIREKDKEGVKEHFAKDLIESFEKHLKENPSFLQEVSLFNPGSIHSMDSYEEKELQQPRVDKTSSKTPLVSPENLGQWDQISSSLAATHLERKSLVSPPQEFEVKCDLGDLTEEEKPYAQVIKNEFEVFNEELKKGRKRLQEELPWNIKKGQEAKLKNDLTEFEKKMGSTCNSLEKDALRLCRKLPEKNQEMQRLLSEQGYQPKSITMRDLARIALKGTEEDYKKVAPQLVTSEIRELHRYVIEYMTAKTSLDHAQSALTLLKEAESPELSLEECKSLHGKAAKFLSMSRQYDPEKNLPALFFEYVSGLRLRKEQASLFKQLIDILLRKGSQKVQGIAFQMMQAGGKSSVILSRLMELLSDEGYLSFFVCHHSQMGSAIGNMKRYQRDRFEKNVIPLDQPEEKLKNIDVLEHILNTLCAAKKNKDSVLMSARFVQLLEGQLILLLKQRRSLEDLQEIKLLDQKIEVLQAINREILESGAGLFDEGDLSLNIFQQVNIPTGARRRLPSLWIGLALTIFKKLCSPEIDRLLNLSKNEQNNFSLSDYLKLIVPEVGRMLIKEVPALQLKREQEGAFLRYLKGIDPQIEKMVLEKQISKNLTLEQQEDFEFLTYLHQTLRASPEIEKQEAAKQIALARGILHKLLPLTLTKVYNRDYGPDPKNPEKTIPYEAVESPTDAEVGNVFELLCYVLQSALNAPLPETVIRLYAEKMRRIANAQISPTLSFEQTEEAKLFLKMSGVSLSKVFEGDHLQKAALAINKSPLHKLNIQAILAEDIVSYYPEFIAMNPLSMIDQFSLTLVTSGTLANVNSFHSKVAHPILDEGAEGKIISTLLERFDGKGKKIEPVDVNNLPQCIEHSLKLVPDKDLHVFFDGEGVLTRFSGRQVANEILSYCSKRPQAQIEGIVYYQTSKEGKEGFVLLKKGATIPIPLENTSKQEIEKHGIPVKKLFFSLDELRSTGTDLPIPAKANGVGTIGVNDLRKVGQMVMRLRDLFEGQNLQIIVTQSAYESVLVKSRKLLDLIEKSLKQQAMGKADQTLRSLKQQLPNIVRNRLKRELLHATPKRASAIETDYAPFFETTNPEDPFEIFGFSEENKTGIAILKNEKERQLRIMQQCASKTPELFSRKVFDEIFKEVQSSMEEEILRAMQLPELQCLFPDTGLSTLGLQVQTNTQTQLEQNLQQEMKISVELDEELRSYRGETSAVVVRELEWNTEGIIPWNPSKIGPALHEVSSMLKDCDFDNGWVKKKGLYRRDYSGCFPSHIQMTQNLRWTVAGKPLPFFHPLQKNAAGILLRQRGNEDFESILLSQKDLDFWLTQKQTPKGCWLLNPNGALLIDSQNPIPEEKFVEESLWYANFFNGNIPNLMKKSALTSYLIQAHPLRKHFLLMKAAENSDHRALLETSSLFNEEQQVSTVQASKRLKQCLKVEGMSPEEIANLPPEKVPYVPIDKVQFLKKAEQVQALNIKQLEGLVPDQMQLVSTHQIPDIEKPELIRALKGISQIKRVSLRAAEHLTLEQKKFHPLGVRELKTKEEISNLKDPELISYLKKEQLENVSLEQIPYLNEECVSGLRKKQHIEALRGSKQINAISLESIELLTKEQIGLLSNPVLVRALAPQRIQYLSTDAVPLLDLHKQLPFLSEDRYMYIGRSQYEEMKALTNSEKPFPLHLRPIWSMISPEAFKIYEQMLCQIFFYNEVGESEFNRKFLEKKKNIDSRDFYDMCIEAFRRKKPAKRTDETNWLYYLKQMQTLTREDYLKVAILWNPSRRENANNHVPMNEIFKCKKLQHLELTHCDLTNNDQLFSLENSLPDLTYLDLIHCKMERIPTFIQNSKRLDELFILPKNQGLKLPDWIFELDSLTYLGLHGPWVKEVPAKISNLKNLKKLSIRRTSIKTLPQEIDKLKKLKELLLEENYDLKYDLKGLERVKVILHQKRESPPLSEEISSNNVVKRPEFQEISNKKKMAPPEDLPPTTPDLLKRLTESGALRTKLTIAQNLRELCKDIMPRPALAEACRRIAANNPWSSIILLKIADAFEWLHRSFIKFTLNRSKTPESLEMIARALYLLEPYLQKKREELESISTKIKEGKITFEKLSGEEKRDYLDWVQGTEQEAETKQQFLQTAHKGNSEKVLTNLFLDKVWVMTSVEEVKNSKKLNEAGIYGMAPHIAAGSIKAGLIKAISTDKEPTNIDTFVKDQLLSSLEQATLWSYLMDRKEGIGVVLEQFQERLSKMRAGERVLLPVGTLDHNFLVQIHRTSEEKCDFTIVNTGAGLENHPRFGEIRKFQTAVSYRDVPFTDINRRDTWKNILDCQAEGSEKVGSIYDEIKKITKRGRKEPPSENILDYSTAQLQATCSAAPWWAWLRHEIVEFASGQKNEQKLSAYTDWRVFKNKIKKEIISDSDTQNVREHIEKSCRAKIESQGQVCAILKICDDKKQFDQAIQQTSSLLNQISGKQVPFVDQHYDHYPNRASRWHKLHELSKEVAHEVLYLTEEKQKEFLQILSKHLKEELHWGVSYLTFLDLKQTESSLEMLFQDAKAKGKWKLIGKTLGRLALDPKLGPLAVSLARRWLAPAGLEIAGAKEKIFENFIHFVSRGKGQEKALRNLAIHFRSRDRSLAKELWIQHRKYSGEMINTLVANDNVSIEDLELIEETPLELPQITSLIFSMRAVPLDEKAMKLLHRFVSKALNMEDKECSHLRDVTQMLLNDGFDQIANEIIRLKDAYQRI